MSKRAADPAPEAVSNDPTPADHHLELTARSHTVAGWILVSRITGYGRVAMMAAVLGPTYFGNLFQSMALLPNIVFSLLVGSLIGPILIPTLIKTLDGQETAAVGRLANGILGTMLLAFLAVIVVGIIASPLLLDLVTLAVDDSEIRQQQQEIGMVLIWMLLPQLLCYGIAATGAAVQNAHQHFALAAAAPIAENLGVIVIMAMSAAIFGFGLELDMVSSAQLFLLGLGCTISVALHAGVQWWGAYRVGVALLPRLGWRDPAIKAIMRMALPSSGYLGLQTAVYAGLLIVAGGVPGGVAAFEIGHSFYFLPIALAAFPIAVVQLPNLSRSMGQDDAVAFHATYRSGLAMILFLTLPASLLFFAMPETLARAVAFGEMGNAAGISLVSACIGGLGLGIVGQATLTLSTSASYARQDAISPMRAMIVKATISFAGMAFALAALEGPAILWALGLSASLANLVAALYLHHANVSALPAVAGHGVRNLLVDVAIAAVAVVPGLMVADLLEGVWTSHYQGIGIALAAILVSAAVYLTLQRLRGSIELQLVLSSILASSLSRRPASSGSN